MTPPVKKVTAAAKALPEWIAAMFDALDLSHAAVIARLEAEQEKLGVTELPVAQILNILNGMAPPSDTVRARFLTSIAPALADLVRTGKSRITKDPSALA